MRASNKQLTLLSEAERAALYEPPDFDYEQRLKYLTLTDQELQVALILDNQVFHYAVQNVSNCVKF